MPQYCLATAFFIIDTNCSLQLKDITTHLLHHIVDGIRRFGPVYSTWMFAYVRFNGWICKRALNHYRPEATVMETYRVCFFIITRIMHVSTFE